MKDRIQEAIKEARAKNPGKIISAQSIYESIYKAGIKEAGLQLRARIGGVDEFMDWSDEELRQFRRMTLRAIKDLLKEWGL